jgi:hypothetical protein
MSADLATNAAPDQQNDRGRLARMAMQLFDHWGLPPEDRVSLLGLSAGNRAALARYRKGEPLANSRDLLERVGHLLAIHKNLRLLFPHDRDLAYAWMTTRNRAFGGKTPVEIIGEWGFSGLLHVRAYLDLKRGV